jgi:hypothetical protein
MDWRAAKRRQSLLKRRAYGSDRRRPCGARLLRRVTQVTKGFRVTDLSNLKGCQKVAVVGVRGDTEKS